MRRVAATRILESCMLQLTYTQNYKNPQIPILVKKDMPAGGMGHSLFDSKLNFFNSNACFIVLG
jgi:hypothetical protein